MTINKTYVIIPAYNPGSIIKEVVERTFGYVPNIIIVDDGCDSENKAVLGSIPESKGLTIITHKQNLGKGFAIHTGIKYALEKGAETIIMLDSDGQHNPDELKKFLEFDKNNHHQLVVGVRSEINKMPLRSKIGNVSMAAIFRVLFKQKLIDTQSGYRMMSARFARMFLDNVEPGRYETEMQMLMMAAKNNITIDQIPIETQYIDGNSNSKFRPVADSIRVLGSFAKYAGVGFLSFIIDYSLFLFFTYTIGIYFVSAHILSRICSGTFNFLANRKYVFNHNHSISKSFLKYLVAVALSLSISTVLLYAFVEILNIKANFGKLLAEATTFTLNYFVLKHFVFKQK